MNLTNPERENVLAFLENGIMYEAVKKVLLSVTDVSYPELAEEIKDNSLLGAKMRALAEGKSFIEKGFEKLEEFNKSITSTKQTNKAI